MTPDPFMVDDDSPEWTAADFACARPIREADPGMLEAVANERRRRGHPPVETNGLMAIVDFGYDEPGIEGRA